MLRKIIGCLALAMPLAWTDDAAALNLEAIAMASARSISRLSNGRHEALRRQTPLIDAELDGFDGTAKVVEYGSAA